VGEIYKYLKSICKMDAQELRNLQEAYLEVYEKNDGETMSEARVDAGLSDYQKRENRYKRNNYDKPLLSYTQPPARGRKKIKGEKREDKYGVDRQGNVAGKYKKMKEETDIYDLILSHLLDEGYAETPEAAEAIMVNMSEEWRNSILG
jgi:hypothetical protein